MLHVVEQLASESGVNIEKVNEIFITFSNRLVTRIPALQPLIEEVFNEAGEENLARQIRKLIINLEEQQCKEMFGSWMLPKINEVTHFEQSNDLF